MKQVVKSVIKNGKFLKKQYDSCHIGAYAAESAFFLLVSAVPLIMLAVIMFTLFAPLDVVGITEFLRGVLTENASEAVMVALNEIVSHSAIPFVSVTTVFLLWAATKGIRSIGDGINVIYGTEDDYNIVWLTARSVGYAFSIFAVFVLSLGVLVFASPLEKLIFNFLSDKLTLLKTLLTLLSLRNIIFFTALTLLFATAYKGLAKGKITFKSQLPGAMLAAGGWILYSFGYSIYIRYFSRYSALYGSLGAVMLFLLWLYMCMNILLCGALFNKLQKDKKDKCD